MQNSSSQVAHSLIPKEHNINNEYYSEDDDGYFDTEDEWYGPLRKRVDFLSRLPCEVVNMILEELSTTDLFECLDVSTKWLDILQNLPNLWYEMVAEHEEYHIISYLSLIGHHVHKYRIYYGCQEILDGSVREILSGNMNNLVSLEWDSSDFICTDVLDCIQHLQSSLTELKLVSTQDTRYLEAFTVPSLSSILDACPTLKRLEVSLHDSNIYEPEVNDNVLPQNIKLTHLHWHPGANTTIEETENILVACPSLIYLSIGSFDNPISTLTTRNQCPLSLRYLHLNVHNHPGFGLYSYGSNDGDSQEESNSNIGRYNIGLKGLSVECEGRERWNELEAVIRMDQNMLQSLTICHRETFNLASLLGIFEGSTLFLTYGYIYWRVSASINATLYKDAPYQQGDQKKSAALQRQQLKIRSSFETSSFQDRHLPWFLNGLRGIWKTSVLQFSDCNIEASHIESILQISELQELSISTIMRKPLGIKTFMVLLDGICESTRQRNVPRIQKLCLGTITDMTDIVLARFADVKSLKSLTLQKCDRITDNGVRCLVDQSPNLYMLSISRCEGVTSEALDYIKQNIDLRQRI